MIELLNRIVLMGQRRTFACCFVCIALVLAACSGLAGEPQIVATLPPRPTQVADAGAPSAQPDLMQGAQIYALRCTRCHGETGAGDGELVLSGDIAEPPPDFTNPATAQGQSPSQWFETITNGRLDKLMPPWNDSLSETERWAVALFTYTMSYRPEQITQGQAVWSANCSECHGDTGAGDGPRADELNAPIGNLAEPGALLDLSDSALFDLVTQGIGDAMPAFGATLDYTARRAAVSYARTLSLANADFTRRPIPSPAATAEVEVASAAEVLGTISGQVTNATSGGAVPHDLTMTLHILDSQFNEESLETTVTDDGTFTFNDVVIRDDNAYIVTTAYQDRVFGSSMMMGGSLAALDLPVTLYELTDDRSAIQMTDVVMQITGSPDSLQVAQIVNFRNTSDRLYSRNEQVGDGRYASVVVPLPRGAQVFDFAGETERYVFAPDLTAVIDTMPVMPGENHIVHVLYTLPYQDGSTIELPLEYDLEGPVQLMLQPDSLGLFSEQLPPLGPQSMGGSVYQSYGASLSLPAGTMLTYSVIGSVSGDSTALVTSPNLLAYVLMAVGSLALLAAAALYYFGRRLPAPQASRQQLQEVIVEQIAELDELHQQGKIDPTAYQRRRASLKARLAKLMDGK